MRTDANTSTSGTVSILNNSGLAVGSSSSFRATVSGNDVTLRNQTSGGNLYFGVNVAGNVTPTLTMFGANGAISGNQINANYADVAERYLADADYPVGTVLVIGGDKEVTQSNTAGQTSIAGTVSENPGVLMNRGLEGEHVAAVALLGRVPCRVVGVINKGDLLMSSDFPGVACKLENYTPGCVIGKALESYSNNTEGTIEIMVGRL
jgi:hypothetical protein